MMNLIVEKEGGVQEVDQVKDHAGFFLMLYFLNKYFRRKDDRDRDRERDYLSRRYDDDSRSSKRKSDRDLNKKRSTARVDEKDISDDRERKRKKHDKDKIIGRSE